jgi:hypothetical protein
MAVIGALRAGGPIQPTLERRVESMVSSRASTRRLLGGIIRAGAAW